jgi:hypothetical protein
METQSTRSPAQHQHRFHGDGFDPSANQRRLEGHFQHFTPISNPYAYLHDPSSYQESVDRILSSGMEGSPNETPSVPHRRNDFGDASGGLWVPPDQPTAHSSENLTGLSTSPLWIPPSTIQSSPPAIDPLQLRRVAPSVPLDIIQQIQNQNSPERQQSASTPAPTPFMNAQHAIQQLMYQQQLFQLQQLQQMQLQQQLQFQQQSAVNIPPLQLQQQLTPEQAYQIHQLKLLTPQQLVQIQQLQNLTPQQVLQIQQLQQLTPQQIQQMMQPAVSQPYPQPVPTQPANVQPQPQHIPVAEPPKSQAAMLQQLMQLQLQNQRLSQQQPQQPTPTQPTKIAQLTTPPKTKAHDGTFNVFEEINRQQATCQVATPPQRSPNAYFQHPLHDAVDEHKSPAVRSPGQNPPPMRNEDRFQVSRTVALPPSAVSATESRGYSGRKSQYKDKAGELSQRDHVRGHREPVPSNLHTSGITAPASSVGAVNVLKSGRLAPEVLESRPRARRRAPANKMPTEDLSARLSRKNNPDTASTTATAHSSDLGDARSIDPPTLRRRGGKTSRTPVQDTHTVESELSRRRRREGRGRGRDEQKVGKETAAERERPPIQEGRRRPEKSSDTARKYVMKEDAVQTQRSPPPVESNSSGALATSSQPKPRSRGGRSTLRHVDRANAVSSSKPQYVATDISKTTNINSTVPRRDVQKRVAVGRKWIKKEEKTV